MNKLGHGIRHEVEGNDWMSGLVSSNIWNDITNTIADIASATMEEIVGDGILI
jgi:hypothetical protein